MALLLLVGSRREISRIGRELRAMPYSQQAANDWRYWLTSFPPVGAAELLITLSSYNSCVVVHFSSILLPWRLMWVMLCVCVWCCLVAFNSHFSCRCVVEWECNNDEKDWWPAWCGRCICVVQKWLALHSNQLLVILKQPKQKIKINTATSPMAKQCCYFKMAVADDVPMLGDIAKLVQYDKLIANNDMQVSTAQEPQRVRQHPFATCMWLQPVQISAQAKLDWSEITAGSKNHRIEANWSLKPHILIVNVFANTNVTVNVFAKQRNKWKMKDPKKRFKHTNTSMRRSEERWGTSFVGRPPKRRVCYVSCFA